MTPRDPPELAAIRAIRRTIEAQLMAATEDDKEEGRNANWLEEE